MNGPILSGATKAFASVAGNYGALCIRSTGDHTDWGANGASSTFAAKWTAVQVLAGRAVEPMRHDFMEYIHLKPNSELPDIAHLYPFKAVVLIDDAVLPKWQEEVSSWLVLSGCRYMMACGRECSSWDDSVDEASIAEFEFNEVPDCNFVLTTWHKNEPMSEVFWYAKNSALHPALDLKNTVVLHISNMPRENIKNEYENA